jgi:protein SERAC1
MLFFGTPHHGSVKTALLNMVPDMDNPRRSLLHETEPESDVLRIQVTDFKNIVGDRKIASFYETEPTPTPQMVYYITPFVPREF